MGSDRETILKKAVMDTLESMAFVSLTEKTTAFFSDEMLSSGPQRSLPVIKPEGYGFVISMSSALIRETAANILGIGPEEMTAENETDALSEILNTIAGNFMREYISPDTTYELGLPEAGSLSSKERLPEGSKIVVDCPFESETGEYLVVQLLGKLN